MIFRYFRRVRDTIDRTGGSVDESFHASRLRGQHHRFEGIQIDRRTEILVKFEAGVIRNTSEGDDSILSSASLSQFVGVADVASKDSKIGVPLRQVFVAEIRYVLNGYVIAEIQHLRHQQAAAIACSAGNQYILMHNYLPIICPLSEILLGSVLFRRIPWSSRVYSAAARGA